MALAPVLVAIDALYLNIRALHFTIQEWKHVAVTIKSRAMHLQYMCIHLLDFVFPVIQYLLS